MAAIAKNGNPSPVSRLIPATNLITGLICGEDISPGDACYIKSSDGKVWRSIGTAVNAAAKVRGYAATKALVAQNDAVSLVTDSNWVYGTGLTPGTDVFLSATAGALADTATTGGTAPIGYVVDATRVRLFPSRY